MVIISRSDRTGAARRCRRRRQPGGRSCADRRGDVMEMAGGELVENSPANPSLAPRLAPAPPREPSWGDGDTNGVSHLPAVRGGLRARDHLERRRVTRVIAATATTCSATASSAPRARRSSSSTRTPTACARRSSGATASSSRRRGTRRSPRSSAGLTPIIEKHGRDAVAIYLGNPNAHNLAGMLYGRPLVKALGTHEPLLGQHGRPAPQGARRRR